MICQISLSLPNDCRAEKLTKFHVHGVHETLVTWIAGLVSLGAVPDNLLNTKIRISEAVKFGYTQSQMKETRLVVGRYSSLMYAHVEEVVVDVLVPYQY